MSKEFLSPATLPPPVGYSHIAKVNKGALISLAGQVSSDASNKLVGEGNFEAQPSRCSAISSLRSRPAGPRWRTSSS
jgi:enamine deaminase RidA (YjgF/YER057c/UK114 family)